jgi:iron complex transport system substrate-binding protein
MNLVSFLPAATEMVYALGLGPELRAVTHECDYPAEARQKPVVVRLALDLAGLSPREIDERVSRQIHEQGTIYHIDEAVLQAARPDLVLTQNLCQVCAPSGTEATRALALLRPPPEILWMSPRSLEGIAENIRDLGSHAHRETEAQRLSGSVLETVASLASETRRLPRRRVFCLEWADPVFCAGHWVPEMVDAAGGADGLARRGVDSTRIPWEEVVRWAPEVLVLAPCGYHLARAREEARRLVERPGWETLPAVREGRVFAVDADSYISRPGPRIAQGARLLAHLIHPEAFDWSGPSDAFARIET